MGLAALKSLNTNESFYPLEKIRNYPKLRFMGSKYRLLPWIYEILTELEFESALDAFSGSGCVSYILKSMGKKVYSNDFLKFCSAVTKATIENNDIVLDDITTHKLLKYSPFHRHFIENKFSGIFFTPEDLRFLDRVSWNIQKLSNQYQKHIAIAALNRGCVKRQPRGVFSVSGDPEKYKDGRRDLKLSLKEHFLEQIQIYNNCVFNNKKSNLSLNENIFDVNLRNVDLVYMDPPYIPRSDDNCYIKRYHFLEGLSCYWRGQNILEHTKVKKIEKKFTPFSYRKHATQAFNQLFSKFSKSIIVLSYSSNGYPDLETLISLLKKHKGQVKFFEKNHRYHFGTHKSAVRNNVQEYLVLGY